MKHSTFNWVSVISSVFISLEAPENGMLTNWDFPSSFCFFSLCLLMKTGEDWDSSLFPFGDYLNWELNGASGFPSNSCYLIIIGIHFPLLLLWTLEIVSWISEAMRDGNSKKSKVYNYICHYFWVLSVSIFLGLVRNYWTFSCSLQAFMDQDIIQEVAEYQEQIRRFRSRR